MTVDPDPDDQRARIIHLTELGRAEQAVLDRESDQLAASLLAPLDGERRQRLLDAMATVERLLTAGLVDVRVEDPDSRAARFCIESYFSELEVRFPHGFDRSITISADGDEIREPNGLLLVARLRGEPVGCGALKFHGAEPTELKRMWVANATRRARHGASAAERARGGSSRRGVTIVHLETNSSLVEAISLYLSTGYVEVPRFNDEPHSDHWFEKHL